MELQRSKDEETRKLEAANAELSAVNAELRAARLQMERDAAEKGGLQAALAVQRPVCNVCGGWRVSEEMMGALGLNPRFKNNNADDQDS